MTDCLIIKAKHEEAANDYMKAETEEDRLDALDRMNDAQTQLIFQDCL